jgi:hypothetical protein
MISAANLNRIGLGAGMIGVLLIFIWGPPQPVLEEGVSLGLEDGTPLPEGGTVADRNQRVKARRRRHVFLSRFGLMLVGVGFLCQLLATYCND